MKGLEVLLNPDEHMNPEEAADHAAQFTNDLALLPHQQRAAADKDAPPSTGICNDCGNDIDPRRVAALPHCTRCIYCQQAEDKKDKRYGS